MFLKDKNYHRILLDILFIDTVLASWGLYYSIDHKQTIKGYECGHINQYKSGFKFIRELDHLISYLKI